MKTTRKNTTTLLVWKIPPDLKGRFKAACATRKISMTQAIVKFMESYVVEVEQSQVPRR